MLLTLVHKTSSACITAIAVSVIFLSGAQLSTADTRLDAVNAVSDLKKNGRGNKMTDEMKSLEVTFATAEQYYLANDTANSEQYYRLTIQKARILADHPEQLLKPQLTNTTQTDSLKSGSSPTSAIPTLSKSASQPELADAANKQEAKPVDEEILSEKLVGTASSYTVVSGDTLRLVAAKLGVSRQHLSRMNKLDAKATLKIGQKLKYNNRKIIPLRLREGIVVNIPDRTLYYFQHGKLVRSIPVALGTATKNDKYIWQTPTGKFKVTSKQEDPTWYVPPSIQAEMEEEGKEVITSVPPGPDNPLGKYAIKTSIPGILIHSTIKPWSIYSFASHGCIRVYPAQMEEFFKEVKVNTAGEIIYQPVKLAVTEEGRVFLEVHQDVYSKSSGLAAEAKRLVEKNQLADRIDWKKFEAVVKQKLGIAEDITM